jgi:hypothetical protein
VESSRVSGARLVVSCVGAVALAACGGGSASVGASTSSSGTSTTTGSTTTSTGGVDSSTSPGESTTEAPPDLPPPTPLLLSPDDCATDVPISTELCWEPVADPEGEPVRYRVFVDDMELTEGRLGPDPGHEGPCVGPLVFAHERTYRWQVEAFEADDPTQTSPRSDEWTFTTIDDGTHVVFEDRFDDDLGWQIEGDASQGAWVRGDPVGTMHDLGQAQPDRCARGQSCYFTGQNPDAINDAADLAGGSTVMISPTFDLSEAAAATVRVRRWFYKSNAPDDASLRVELLVPDLAAVDGFEAYPLELLDAGTVVSATNLWSPVELSACDVPMRADSRLRITATDHGDGILEAAIDSVSVIAHDDPSVCGTGEGAFCRPEDGAQACPDELLCCAQGAVHEGAYRCFSPVAGLVYGDPPPTPRSSGNGPPGCDAADLMIDEGIIDPIFTDIVVADDSCELLEGCVDSTGVRTVMLFSLMTPNIGSRDLVLGVPANMPELFDYGACHDHYHFEEYARYELRDAEGMVARGHKQAFCLLDTYAWAWPNMPQQYTCSNQGISRGYADTYAVGLPCQWIDITSVPPGEYTLRIALNQPRADSLLPQLVERDYENNILEVPVTIP